MKYDWKEIIKRNRRDYLISCIIVILVYPLLYLIQTKELIKAGNFLLLIPTVFLLMGFFSLMFILLFEGEK